MNNYIKIGIAVAVLLLIGISVFMAIDRNNKGTKQNNLEKHIQIVDPEQAEKDFIKKTIENSLFLKDSLEELKVLFAVIDEQDSKWRVDVEFVLNDFALAGNNVSYINLNDEQKEKYKETLAAEKEATEKIQSLRADIDAALDIYDRKALENISPRIDKALELVQSVLENIEMERYE